MTTNLQTTPYLPRQRNFPRDNSQVLGIELDKSYIEIASRVNERTIGIYAVNFPIVTGNQWFLIGQPQRQQTIRQAYVFTSTVPINHGINVTDPSQFVLCSGSYTNGTNSFGLPFATSVAIAGQITFYLTATQIIFVVGAGAPALTSGKIILEWISAF